MTAEEMVILLIAENEQLRADLEAERARRNQMILSSVQVTRITEEFKSAAAIMDTAGREEAD